MLLDFDLSYLRFTFLFLNIYNPGCNILELYNILVKIWFTMSKMKLDV